MKLCSICRTSEILCSGCRKKLDTGHITQTEIEVSRALAKVIEDADFLKAVEHKNQIILLCDTGKARFLIGRAGKNVRELSRLVGKDVRIIEKADEKTMIENILGSPVVGINIVYGGIETKRIRVDSNYRRLRGDAELLEKLLENKYEILFE